MFFQILILSFIALIDAKTSNSSSITNSTHVLKTINITSVVPVNVTRDGKTYFFKYNTDNNQFRIYNRVNMNSEPIRNISARSSVKTKPISKFEKAEMNELRKVDAFLDEEWNYSSSKTINTTELPFQVYPFMYNAMLETLSKRKDNSNGKLADVTKILFNRKKENSTILSFQFGKIDLNQSIDHAELHFYWFVPEDSEFYKNSCVLRLFEVEKMKNDTEKNPDTNKLLNVIYASKATTGWQMFRISKRLMENWPNKKQEMNFIIAASVANQINSTTVFNDTNNETKWRTFLVLKINDKSDQHENLEFDPHMNSTNSISSTNKYCSRKKIYVDFKKLHWNNFIIAPGGFMAYDCLGKCARHNAHSYSSHLRVLMTFRDFDEETRSPCCVPIKYYALPIMFYDKFGNVVAKIYKDLIVAKCGCR